MITQIASNSIREGRSWSRLPVFSEKWIEMIRGSSDFFGLNYYTSRMIETVSTAELANPSYQRDMNLKQSIKPEWKPSASSWLYSVPEGLGDILRCILNNYLLNIQMILIDGKYSTCRWIKDQYNNPEIIVTENGWSDEGDLVDDGRIEYLRDHLKQILNVVLNEEVNLKAYTGETNRI